MNAMMTQVAERCAPMSVGPVPAAPWPTRRGTHEANTVGRVAQDGTDATGNGAVWRAPAGQAQSRREDTGPMMADADRHGDTGCEPWDGAAPMAHVACAAAMAERRRLARNLHDSVTQTLLGLQWTAQAAADLWDTQPAQARAALETIRHLAVGATVEMRALLLDLHDAVLEQQGLLPALEAYGAVVRQRSGLHVDLRLGERGAAACAGSAGTGTRLPCAHEEALYYIAREALANVVKHARASHATITLQCDTSVRLVVEDDGGGFGPSPEPAAATYGLTGMRERVEALGGRLLLENRPAGGARVVAELPLPN